MQKLTFLGASGTVTGSRFLLEADRNTILVDCGLFQGGSALRAKNWDPFPADVRRIGAVLLTHAHIDHTGYLPRLVREGYAGPVFCTADESPPPVPASRRRSFQEEEGRATRTGRAIPPSAGRALFTEEDARRALQLLRELPFDQEPSVLPGVQVSLTGSATSSEPVSSAACGRRPDSLLSGTSAGGTPILKTRSRSSGEVRSARITYGDRLHGAELAASSASRRSSATRSPAEASS
jgi:metallo-beta-lactamase family protein